MLLYFLGTGAGKPSLERNVTSLALRMPAPPGDVWLFDCGEGTQHQILASPWSLRKVTRIFVTHLHGDHIFGLPGLLASRSFSSKDVPLNLYGPMGLRRFVETALDVSGTRLSYPLEIRELRPDEELEIEDWRVRLALLEHGLPSYGYRLEEPDRPGRLDAERLKELKVPPGPIYGLLKAGETVTLDDGRVINGQDFVGPPRRGRHVVILGDTRYTAASLKLAKEADVLVHEATFGGKLEDRAYEFFHSTPLQAAQIAKDADVKMLILTHFSSRYTPQTYQKLVGEARTVFPNTYLAEDHSSFAIPLTE